MSLEEQGFESMMMASEMWVEPYELYIYSSVAKGVPMAQTQRCWSLRGFSIEGHELVDIKL